MRRFSLGGGREQMKKVQIQSSPRGKNFPRVTCIERERDRKRLSFARERAAVKSSPVGDEKTNGGGPVRNRVRSATFPSSSRSTMRELGNPSIVVYSGDIATSTSRENNRNRGAGKRLTGFKCQLRYSEKGKISLLLFYTARFFARK